MNNMSLELLLKNNKKDKVLIQPLKVEKSPKMHTTCSNKLICQKSFF